MSSPAYASGPSPDPSWRARLIGAIELQRGQQVLRQFGGRNVEALFGRLALRPGEAVSREALAELLWPGAAAEVSRNRLRNALAGLREALRSVGAEELLDAGRATLRLSGERLSSDVQRLEALQREPLAAALPAELAGELMPGHPADWVADERLRLALLVERVAERHRSASTVSESPPRASAAVPRRRTSPLPEPISRFFGREPELAALRERLAAHRLVTVCGPGGAGKTRLVLECGRGLASRQAAAQRVAWVPLADCNDLRQVPEQVLAALDAPATQVVMQSAAGATGVDPVAEALETAPTLLVLDNVEQFEPALLAPLLGAWLERVAGLRLLLTSRRPLGLVGEQVLWLAPLPLPGAGEPPLASPAVQLFLDRGRASRADVFGPGEPGPEVMADIVRLCELLDGTPLAIELAAARLLAFSPTGLLAALSQGPAAASALLRRAGGGPARQASIDSTLAWSLALLPAEAQPALPALSVFAGSFTAEAAAAVCALARPQATLELLVTQSLLQREGEAHGQARFRLLRRVAEFAGQRLSDGDRAVLRQRHRDAFLALARATPRAAADRLAPDDANLRAAIASAVDDERPADAVALGAALGGWFERRGIAPATLEALCRAAERTAAGTPHRLDLLLTLADLLLNGAGRPEEAAGYAEQALAECGSPRERALALYMKARIGWARTLDPAGLKPLLEEAVALARGAGDAEAEARALWILGPVLRRLDRDPVAAEAAYRRAGVLFDAAGDPIMANRMVYLRANCAMQLGEPERALALHRVCAERCRALDDRIGRLRQSNEQGVALLALKRWCEAARTFGDTVALAWEHHHLYLLVFGLFNLPQAAVHCGAVEDACRLASFAARRWTQHVGPMSAAIVAESQAVPDAARPLIGDAAVQALAVEGEVLALPAAVALALDVARRAAARAATSTATATAP